MSILVAPSYIGRFLDFRYGARQKLRVNIEFAPCRIYRCSISNDQGHHLLR